MALVSINIPQIGEGLQEARLVAVLKQPGEAVKRDEPIYQMETDKSVMDVESPYEGVLSEWLAEVDSILPIGAPVATMEVAGEVEAPAAGHGAPIAAAQESAAASGVRGANIPPRTRAYAKEKGVSEADLAKLAEGKSKLMPEDIDAFLGGGASTNDAYDQMPMQQKQRLLASRMVRGNALVVPGTISVAVNWGPIEAERARVKASGSEFQPSSFTMFAYAVTKALKDFPAFRSTMIGDDQVRVYHHVSLGIAVALPGDELVLAVVEEADTLNWTEFATRARERIELARSGKDQANESVTVSLTNMQSYGLRDAVPVVVPPSVATIFLGETYGALDQDAVTPAIKRYANVAITFDHRIINGVGAAEFIKAIKANVESITVTLGTP